MWHYAPTTPRVAGGLCWKSDDQLTECLIFDKKRCRSLHFSLQRRVVVVKSQTPSRPVKRGFARLADARFGM